MINGGAFSFLHQNEMSGSLSVPGKSSINWIIDKYKPDKMTYLFGVYLCVCMYVVNLQMLQDDILAFDGCNIREGSRYDSVKSIDHPWPTIARRGDL